MITIKKDSSIFAHWYRENVVWRQICNPEQSKLVNSQITFFQGWMRGVRK